MSSQSRPRYLLDTNIVSYLVRQSPVEVLRRYEQSPQGWLAVSVLTEAEILYGLAKNPAARATELLRGFLLRTEILPWTSEAAAKYATLRADRERAGKPMAELDMQIASHALSLNAILVTRDRVFHDIPGLICEDWSRPEAM
jgi:tRNA(fMet)-specific endonuclease VapC